MTIQLATVFFVNDMCCQVKSVVSFVNDICVVFIHARKIHHG